MLTKFLTAWVILILTSLVIGIAVAIALAVSRLLEHLPGWGMGVIVFLVLTGMIAAAVSLT